MNIPWSSGGCDYDFAGAAWVKAFIGFFPRLGRSVDEPVGWKVKYSDYSGTSDPETQRFEVILSYVQVYPQSYVMPV